MSEARPWQVWFRPEAQAELRAIPKPIAMRILKKLTDLEKDPYGLDSTALVGDPARRRLRIGDYRVIYTLDHGKLIIWVVQVGNRATIYTRLDHH